jgi:hypothetical protein
VDSFLLKGSKFNLNVLRSGSEKETIKVGRCSLTLSNPRRKRLDLSASS